MKTDSIINAIIRSVTVMLLLINFVGCSDKFIEGPEQPVFIGESFKITGTIAIPDMPQAMTRSALGETAGENLKLTVFEFDLGSDAAHSFLSNIYKAEIDGVTNVANGGTVKFNLTLKAASTAKVLHFMVSDKYLTSQFGSIASILPTLTVGEVEKNDNNELTFNEKEAYWGYVEFSNGYTKKDAIGNPIYDEDGKPILLDEVKTKLKNVPVVRNFAQISVEVAESVDNFELLGFDIVNVPTAGTVAPWNQNTLSVPILLNGNTMKKYSEISTDPDESDNIDEGYDGIVPAQAQFRNVEAEAKKWTSTSTNMQSTASRYIYEHPYESTRRTYLIVHGIFTEKIQATNEEKKIDCFYKLDIGSPGENKMFQYFNIIRNIHYKVIISEVHAAGANSVSAAIDRAPFNNLSAATETSSMLNISDGENLLIVNATTHVITNTDKIDILYRYRKKINTMTPEDDNSIAHVVGLKKGTVVSEYTENPVAYTDKNGVNWMKIEITPNQPTATVETQSFTIVDGNGLGRTINLILREPWPYAPVYKNEYGEVFYATVANGDDNLYDPENPEPQVISPKSGEPLTVYFNLPDGLPEEMFPLAFQIESKYQWIENNKIGNLIVSTGPSLFDPSVTAISYIKTVSYQEYIHLYINDGSNNLDVNTTNTNHTVRCRFLTIAEAEGEAEIRIHCPYFSPDPTVKFERGDGAGEMQ